MTDVVQRFEETKREMLTVIMLKDVLDGIEHHFGKDGLDLVAEFATMQNRARESNRVMDELEKLYGTPPLPSKERQP